jgi:hypothetical protein
MGRTFKKLSEKMKRGQRRELHKIYDVLIKQVICPSRTSRSPLSRSNQNSIHKTVK